MTPDITAAITTALAMIVGVLSVVLGVVVGHRMAERSRLRDRLRIAFADFVSAIWALLREKVVLEIDRAAMLKVSSQGATREDRHFFELRFDASSRRLF